MSGKLSYSRAIEPCQSGASRTIFDSPSQRVAVDPATVRMLSDRCLIRDLPQDDSIVGSLVVPEIKRTGGVGKDGLLRIGVVVAVGPGDRYFELGLDVDGESVRRKLLTQRCLLCDGLKKYRVVSGEGDDQRTGPWCDCPGCDGSGRAPVTMPPQCQPGDTVLYSRMRHEEILIAGERYVLCHAEQAVLAVLEP